MPQERAAPVACQITGLSFAAPSPTGRSAGNFTGLVRLLFEGSTVKGANMTEWKNADEWMPPNGKRVLVFLGKGNPPRTEISTFNLTHQRWDSFDVDEITHWAEMPAFPSLAAVEQSSALPLPKKCQQELFDHLITKFDPDYAKFCVVSLALDIESYEINEEILDWTDEDYRRKSDASTAAHRLYRQCRDDPRLEKYAAYCWALSSDLMVIAQEVLQQIPKKRGKGRPPETRCREELIKRVYGHYPKELRKKVAYNHFEQTVDMVLKWVEPDPPKDIHAAIIRALGRKNDFQ